MGTHNSHNGKKLTDYNGWEPVPHMPMGDGMSVPQMFDLCS